jgi:hypothetical protein
VMCQLVIDCQKGVHTVIVVGFGEGDSPEDSETPGIGWCPLPHSLRKSSDPTIFGICISFLVI